MSSFHEDKLAHEKKDPIESSSPKFIIVPLMLLSAFLGFGITFLALRTDRITMEEGDSRTHVKETEAAPPAAAEAKAAPDDPAAMLAHGKQIFTTTCQVCHQANGLGVPGAFPPLEGSEWVTGSTKRIVAILLHGINGEIVVKGEKFQNAMPPFKDQFSSADIAAVATFIRQTFGKKTDVITAATVDEVKSKTASHAGPWAGGAELDSQKWD